MKLEQRITFSSRKLRILFRFLFSKLGNIFLQISRSLLDGTFYLLSPHCISLYLCGYSFVAFFAIASFFVSYGYGVSAMLLQHICTRKAKYLINQPKHILSCFLGSCQKRKQNHNSNHKSHHLSMQCQELHVFQVFSQFAFSLGWDEPQGVRYIVC